jgi:hypothetical protein
VVSKPQDRVLIIPYEKRFRGVSIVLNLSRELLHVYIESKSTHRLTSHERDGCRNLTIPIFVGDAIR